MGRKHGKDGREKIIGGVAVIKDIWNGLKRFCKTVFGPLMESDGKLSMTRISIVAVLGFYIYWANQIVEATGVIPDIPYALAGLISLLYNFNKGGTISLGGGAGGTKG